MKRLLGGAGAALGVKIATGFAIAAAAASMAAVATEVATTGSVNPADWGQQVTQQVQTCKDTLRASGTRGIGQCVSQFAKQHGQAVSDSHRASASRGHGNSDNAGNGHGNGNGNGKNKSHGQGSDNSQGSRSETASTGEPTDEPTVIVHTMIPPQP